MRAQDRRAFIFFFSVTLFALVLTSMYLAGHKVVHTEIVINAPTEKVWAALTDRDSYRIWHSVIEHVDGQLEPGQRVVSHWTDAQGDQHRVESDVVRYKEERLLNLYGGVPLVLTFDHRFELEPVPEGTRLIQHEEYRGIWVVFFDTTQTQAAYAASNAALAEFITSGASNKAQ